MVGEKGIAEPPALRRPRRGPLGRGQAAGEDLVDSGQGRREPRLPEGRERGRAGGREVEVAAEKDRLAGSRQLVGADEGVCELRLGRATVG